MIALLLTIWSLAVQTSAGGMSNNVATYLSVYNGYFDNKAQNQADSTSHGYIQFRAVPVTTPALPGKTVMFFEWAYNGVIIFMELCDPSENSQRVIQLDLYNFTDPTQYKPGEYKLESLSKLTPGNLQRPSKCQSEFVSAGPDRFVGSWPSCKHLVDGKPALYTHISTCNSIEVAVPPAATEQSSAEPYNFKLKGDRFTLPGAPDGFVSPCK